MPLKSTKREKVKEKGKTNPNEDAARTEQKAPVAIQAQTKKEKGNAPGHRQSAEPPQAARKT
jgi:hypothetical protein